MPSVSSKGKAKPSSKPSNAPRSRNTTPLPPSGTARVSAEPPTATSYFRSSMVHLAKDLDGSFEELVDRGGSAAQTPSGAALNNVRDQIQKRVVEPVKDRSAQTDRLLRELQRMRSQRSTHDRERERERIVDRERDRDRDRERDADDRKHKLKKVRKRDPDEERPLAVGAHGVARQDGVGLHQSDIMSTESSPISQPPPSATGTGPADEPSPSISEASHQPPPAPAIPQFQTFGPDPSKFDDPTIYHIRDVNPTMAEEQIKEIYCVAEYPQSDLHELTPGTPPDKDFSNAKPASQVNATVFANYVEPYIRPLTEEDVAFLKERGDRLLLLELTRRGARHYKEVWADEDGAMNIDTSDARLPPNEARGCYDDLSDDILDTDTISAGPLLSRLLSTLRPEGRGNQNSEANGINPDAMDIDEATGAPADTANNNSLPAATQLSELLQPGWKAPPPLKPDYVTIDERLLMEVKHYGLIPDGEDGKANYDDHDDDEVGARLRLLQSELRKQSVINGARKQRLLELTEERMAQQEYNTIADDLDNQLNAAYLKRNRNIGKGKKQTKRPGGPGGGSHPVPNAGLSRPSVGEPIRILMERKGQWNSTIGPVVNYGKTGLPLVTIFSEERMKVLENKELEDWNPEIEE